MGASFRHYPVRLSFLAALLLQCLSISSKLSHREPAYRRGVEDGQLKPGRLQLTLLPPDARAYGTLVSAALHAFLLLVLALPQDTKRQAPLLQESLPVEIWTPEQMRELTRPSLPGIRDHNLPQPETGTGELDSGQGGTIRATRILSGEALAHPLSRKMREMLPLFEEETRLEQLCGLEAMAQIAELLKQFQPDRVVAYARADVKISDTIVKAEGAAFRSHRRWYALTFRCGLNEDRQAVKSFEFSVGKAIPKRLWEQYNLPDPTIDRD